MSDKRQSHGERSWSPERHLYRERSWSQERQSHRENYRSQERQLNRDRSWSPDRQLSRERSWSPDRQLKRERSWSPDRQLNRERRCRPKEKMQSDKYRLRKDPRWSKTTTSVGIHSPYIDDHSGMEKNQESRSSIKCTWRYRDYIREPTSPNYRQLAGNDGHAARDEFQSNEDRRYENALPYESDSFTRCQQHGMSSFDKRLECDNKTVSCNTLRNETNGFRDDLVGEILRIITTCDKSNISLIALYESLRRRIGIKFQSPFELQRFLQLNTDNFIINGYDQNYKYTNIKAKTDIQLCSKNADQRNCACSDLHICKFYILSSCNKTSCKFEHNLFSSANLKVLKKHKLHRMGENGIKTLIQDTDSRNATTLPTICKFYNNKGGCKRECLHLNMCLHFINGNCKFWNCKRSHNFFDDQPLHILRSNGISPLKCSDYLLRELLKRTLNNGEIVVTKSENSGSSVRKLLKTEEPDPSDDEQKDRKYGYERTDSLAKCEDEQTKAESTSLIYPIAKPTDDRKVIKERKRKRECDSKKSKKSKKSKLKQSKDIDTFGHIKKETEDDRETKLSLLLQETCDDINGKIKADCKEDTTANSDDVSHRMCTTDDMLKYINNDNSFNCIELKKKERAEFGNDAAGNKFSVGDTELADKVDDDKDVLVDEDKINASDDIAEATNNTTCEKHPKPHGQLDEEINKETDVKPTIFEIQNSKYKVRISECHSEDTHFNSNLQTETSPLEAKRDYYNNPDNETLDQNLITGTVTHLSGADTTEEYVSNADVDTDMVASQSVIIQDGSTTFRLSAIDGMWETHPSVDINEELKAELDQTYNSLLKICQQLFLASKRLYILHIQFIDGRKPQNDSEKTTVYLQQDQI